jgi:hypothetical protein
MMPGMGGFAGMPLQQQQQQPVFGGMPLQQQMGGLMHGATPAHAAPGNGIASQPPQMPARPPKKNDPFADLLG